MNKIEQQEMNKVLQELAALSPMEYDAVREEKAEELGVRVGTLDNEVAKRRADTAEETAESVVEELSPWDKEVDGDDLLNEIRAQITEHTVMQSGCPTAVSVWSLASFCIDAFRVFPKLQLKSPEKRCGKSTLMECLEGVTSRPILASNATPAALFRCVEAWRPTLLIDEADTFAKNNDELNGIINAGHTRRTAFVMRTVGDDHTPKKFSVWGAQVIAGIKSQRDTLEDRSVTIEMRRKLSSEKVSKIPIDYFEQSQHIRRKCLRWAEDNISALKESGVDVPSCGNDRAQDNWLPLFAIANLAGGDWPEKVLSAYKLIEAPDTDKDDSVAVMLLADIKTIFDDSDRDRMHSGEIVNTLIAMDGRPWSEWKRGYPMTKASLSRLLKPHKIKPHQLKIAGTNLNGYERKDFEDAFDRYLPVDNPVQTSTTLQPFTGAGFSDFQDSTTTPSVEFQNSRKPNKDAGCREVEFLQGGTGEGAYPEDLLYAASVAVSGLNVTAGQVIADLEPDDYQLFIDHPETARNIAQRMSYRR